MSEKESGRRKGVSADRLPSYPACYSRPGQSFAGHRQGETMAPEISQLFMLCLAAIWITGKAQEHLNGTSNWIFPDELSTKDADFDRSTEHVTDSTTEVSHVVTTSLMFKSTRADWGETTSSRDVTSSVLQPSASPGVVVTSTTGRPPGSSTTKNADPTRGDKGSDTLTNLSSQDEHRRRSSTSSEIPENPTTPSSKDEHITEVMSTDGTATVQDDTDDWQNAEDCVLKLIECVEPVRCKGQGKIDCSEKDKLPWMTDMYNSSVIDQMLPQEPRQRRSANTKWSPDRRRYEAARHRARQSSASLEVDEDPSSLVPCLTEETLLCTAELNVRNCRGTGSCEVVRPGKGESTSLADWEIAVISVLTLAGILLVFLLVYVIYGA